MNDISFKITIPCDEDGFVLLKCPKCGEYFKLMPSELNSEDAADIHCPLCGLISQNYFTKDVLQLAETMVTNAIKNEMYKEFKKLEKSSSSLLKIKVSKEKEHIEVPIRSIIDSMTIVNYSCCDKSAKVRLLLKHCGSHCPYCGGSIDGTN